MNYLNVVMFSPEDLELVKGSPSARRKFIDSSVSQLYPRYLTSLIDYHKALGQKNSLLKVLRAKGAKSDMMLSVWNEQLAAEGEKIIKYRTDFVKLINNFSAASVILPHSATVTMYFNCCSVIVYPSFYTEYAYYIIFT